MLWPVAFPITLRLGSPPVCVPKEAARSSWVLRSSTRSARKIIHAGHSKRADASSSSSSSLARSLARSLTILTAGVTRVRWTIFRHLLARSRVLPQFLSSRSFIYFSFAPRFIFFCLLFHFFILRPRVPISRLDSRAREDTSDVSHPRFARHGNPVARCIVGRKECVILLL